MITDAGEIGRIELTQIAKQQPAWFERIRCTADDQPLGPSAHWYLSVTLAVLAIPCYGHSSPSHQ
jgi:hypothetical protein